MLFRIDMPDLVGGPRLSSETAAIGLNFFAMTGVYFFMSCYSPNERGRSPLRAGLLTIPVAAGQLASASRSARNRDLEWAV